MNRRIRNNIVSVKIDMYVVYFMLTILSEKSISISPFFTLVMYAAFEPHFQGVLLK